MKRPSDQDHWGITYLTPLPVVPTPDLIRGRDLGMGCKYSLVPQPQIPPLRCAQGRNDGPLLAESGMQFRTIDNERVCFVAGPRGLGQCSRHSIVILTAAKAEGTIGNDLLDAVFAFHSLSP